MTIWLLAGVVVAVALYAVALGLCWAAKRGDEQAINPTTQPPPGRHFTTSSTAHTAPNDKE